MNERITFYVAAPIAQRDDGAILTDPDDAVECASAEAAIECARQMAGAPGYIGAWAFARSGYPGSGWYEDAQVLRRFGGL